MRANATVDISELLKLISISNNYNFILEAAIEILTRDPDMIDAVKAAIAKSLKYINKESITQYDETNLLAGIFTVAHVEVMAIMAEYGMWDFAESEKILHLISDIDAKQRYLHYKGVYTLKSIIKSGDYNNGAVDQSLLHLQPDLDTITLLLEIRYLVINSNLLNQIDSTILSWIMHLIEQYPDHLHVIKYIITQRYRRMEGPLLMGIFGRIFQDFAKTDTLEVLKIWKEHYSQQVTVNFDDLIGQLEDIIQKEGQS